MLQQDFEVFEMDSEEDDGIDSGDLTPCCKCCFSLEELGHSQKIECVFPDPNFSPLVL